MLFYACVYTFLHISSDIIGIAVSRIPIASFKFMRHCIRHMCACACVSVACACMNVLMNTSFLSGAIVVAQHGLVTY